MQKATERERRALDLKPAWHEVDAKGKILGRLCSEIAVLLQGKHKPGYVPYLNVGDFVIVTNADKIKVTGKKLEQKMYYRHSGYHGGLRERKLSVVLANAPTLVIKKAVKGMLPKNTLGRRMISRLKVYAGETHPHEAQVNEGRKTATPAVSESTDKGTEEA
jgi:large subunit ribosomal protein L13